MPSRMTYRVYRRIDGRNRKFLGIVAVPLGVPDEERRVFEMAKSLYGPGPYEHGSDYEIEVQGID
jgi:hypothetical protein